MHARSRLRSLAAAALGLLLGLLGVGIALPASAAPASPDPATVVSALQAALGRSFAGAWFEPGSMDPIVATTDAAAVPWVRAAGAQPRLVSRDLLALHRVVAVLDSRAGSVPDTVTGWYVDPASNSVVVSATDAAAGRAFAAGQDAVRVKYAETRPVPLADLRGGDTMTTSNGGRCSVGFNAISGKTRYIITAGHCTKLGGTWSGEDGNAIGPVAKSTFPDHDFGLIEVTSDSYQQTHDVATGSGYTTVTGVTPAAVGSSVCRSGSSSGYHCGRVQAIGETVNYGDGNVVHGLTETTACAEAGDSGGPFMSGTQAQGTLSGGSGDCLLGGDTYFQPIGEVLSTYGLTLLMGKSSDRNS
ncbi:MAG TPA: S1 family peptidase [Pseudonocardiaceae bacterium]